MISVLPYFTHLIVSPIIQCNSLLLLFVYTIDLDNSVFLMLAFLTELMYKFLKIRILFPSAHQAMLISLPLVHPSSITITTSLNAGPGRWQYKRSILKGYSFQTTWAQWSRWLTTCPSWPRPGSGSHCTLLHSSPPQSGSTEKTTDRSELWVSREDEVNAKADTGTGSFPSTLLLGPPAREGIERRSHE
jgi:hypothetical protein